MEQYNEAIRNCETVLMVEDNYAALVTKGYAHELL